MRYIRLIAIFSLASTVAATSANNATSFALTYGYPLLAFEKLAVSLASAVGVDTFNYGRQLQTAEGREVVRPNADTLYSTSMFDLSRQDPVLTTPAVPGSQFALFSFYDVYGNNFADFGTETTLESGKHLIWLRRKS